MSKEKLKEKRKKVNGIGDNACVMPALGGSPFVNCGPFDKDGDIHCKKCLDDFLLMDSLFSEDGKLL